MSPSDWLSRPDHDPPEDLATAMRNALTSATANRAASQNPTVSQIPAATGNPTASQNPAATQNPAASENPAADENPTADDLLGAAERLLDNVLRTDCETRASALDLLAVDALMTHALLVASADPAAAGDFAERAMHRIAGLGRE